MSIHSSDALVATLSSSRLLTVGQQTELHERLQSRHREPRDLARQLLQRGWLTSFQVNQIFLGRASDLVVGPYILLERLGEGGAGQVFKAAHRHMDRLAALKMIRKELLTDADAVLRFRREVEVVSQLTHPNVVHALDAASFGSGFVLVMEFVEGVDLARLVEKDGALSVAQACDYIQQTALGLQHIHSRGLVHRDIKPSNLMLTRQGTIKILDLGLARLQQPANSATLATVTTTGSILMGTLDYMAPEQALDFRRVDIRADIYSLGCTFYFLLTGRAPFADGPATQKLLMHQLKEPAPISRMRRGVPAAVEQVVRQMMAKRPEDRFTTPGQVAELLGRLSTPGAVQATKTFTPATALVPTTLPVAKLVIHSNGPRQVLHGEVLPAGNNIRQLPRQLFAWKRRDWRVMAVGSALLLLLAVSMLLFLLPGSRSRSVAATTGASPGPLNAPATVPERIVYLADLPELELTGMFVQGNKTFGKGGNLGHPRGGRITVDGVPSAKALNTPVPRGTVVVSYRLDKQYRQFKCAVALDDSLPSSDVTMPLRFTVMGDTQVLWRSEGLRNRKERQTCSVSVKGVERLDLAVHYDGEHGGGWAAVWLDPLLTK